jgi:hypothetical protein
VTDGCETARVREAAGLEKTHATDARVIAGGSDVIPCAVTYRKRKIRCHNRHYFKANTLKGGVRKRNTSKEFFIHGFRRFDTVLLDGEERCFIDGLRANGFFKLRRMDGSLVITSAASSKQKDSSVSWKRLTLIKHADGYISWCE